MTGANDLLIVTHAIALGLTLETNNTAEYERVPGLLFDASETTCPWVGDVAMERERRRGVSRRRR